MKRRLEIIAAAIIVIVTTAVISAAVHAYRQDLEIRHLEQTKSQREKELQNTQDQLKNTHDQKQQLEQKSQDQEKQIQDLNGQLQAKKAEREAIAAAAARTITLTGRASAAAAMPAAPSVIAGCGDNSYAQFIYQHESGCNLNAVNAGGCRGIGQACPGSKLPCGADYACQNAFFTQYANDRYGGWSGAYSAWIAQGWW
jgi:hypothetical protein